MRTIICANSLEWLPAHRNQGAIITSLPDAAELKLNLQDYKAWIQRAARECLLSASENCPVIFLQSDRKCSGKWLSKVVLICNLAEEMGWFLVWHKIELRRGVGKCDLFRPAYRHLLCFGSGTVTSGTSTPDVIDVSHAFYEMGCGIAAAEVAVKFCLQYTNKIIDPFCGRGTIPFVAENQGAEVIGIDIDEECAEASSTASPIEREFSFND